MYKCKRKAAKVLSGIIVTLCMCSIVNAQSIGDTIANDQPHPRIEDALKRLHDQHKKAPAAARQYAREKAIRVRDQDEVTVFIMAEPGKTADAIDRKALKAYGAKIIKGADGVLKVRIPIDKTTEIADNVKGISLIRLPDKPHAQSYQSEGVSLTGAVSYQSAGYTGAGVKVAVLDLDFSELHAAISQGELPDTIVAVDCSEESCTTVSSPYDNLGTDKHGTAVAEIIHDMAPGAQLYLIKIEDRLDLVTAKDFCIAQGVKIINHSVGWTNTNFYDGLCWLHNPVCTADDAYDHGILWVNSAGNYARKHYSAVYTDLNNTELHDQGISIFAEAGETIELSLTWDAWPYTDQDYNLWLKDGNGNIVDYSINAQTGTQPPTEYISYTVPHTGTYLAVIHKFSATANHNLNLYSFNHNITPYVTDGSLASPADANKALSVGAIGYQSWTTGPIASYSSRGPTTDGRIKPDITGPSSVSTYSYGSSAFSGTSASSPHVAGAAALILSKHPDYSLLQLWSALTGAAIDMGNSGMDNSYGYGRLELPCTCTFSPQNYGFSPSSGTGSITVTPSSSTCSWTARSNDSWMTISSSTTGTGSGTVTYNVGGNTTGSARKGTLTLAGSTISIRQAKASFVDDPQNVFTPYIYSIYTEGITVGCEIGYYCPSSNVTRGQMAAFIIRSKFGESFSYTTTPYYSDVPDTHTFFKYVQKLRDEGITVTTGTYMVDDIVPREQMAAFVIRAKYGETFSYTTTPYYSDVPDTNTFFKYIQKLKDEKITTTTGTYMAPSYVTRDQMAAFLGRAFLGME